MVVQLMLKDGQRLSLDQLPEEAQIGLARALGDLPAIDRMTLDAVAEEFLEQLEAMALLPAGGFAGALAALGDQISPAAVARIRREYGLAPAADRWPEVLALSLDDLLPALNSESVEVCAVILSKLPVDRAAAALGMLPGERARRITFAIAQTEKVTPNAVQRIGAALASEYCITSVNVFSDAPSQRLGAILNSAVPKTREELLEGLGSDDPTLAEAVRKAIFTFEDIPHRITVTDVPKITRGVDNATLVAALLAAQTLGGESAKSTEFVLSNMSQRMADQLREEMTEKGKVKKAEGEAAQAEVIGEIRRLIDAGDISLIEEEEEDAED